VCYSGPYLRLVAVRSGNLTLFPSRLTAQTLSCIQLRVRVCIGWCNVCHSRLAVLYVPMEKGRIISGWSGNVAELRLTLPCIKCYQTFLCCTKPRAVYEWPYGSRNWGFADSTNHIIRYLARPSATFVHFSSPQPMSTRFLVMYSSHLSLGLPTRHFFKEIYFLL